MHSADFTDVDSVKLDSRGTRTGHADRLYRTACDQTVESLDDEHVKDATIKIGEQSLISGRQREAPLIAASV